MLPIHRQCVNNFWRTSRQFPAQLRRRTCDSRNQPYIQAYTFRNSKSVSLRYIDFQLVIMYDHVTCAKLR